MTRQERPERRLSDQTSQDVTNQPIARSGGLAEALERLETAVGRIQDSDTFRAYLDVQARFHRYSPNNALLILAQRPDATRVAGYRAWQSLGRQVKRGERGIKILVPMSIRERAAGSGPDAGDIAARPDLGSAQERVDDPASARRRLLFGVGTVFDLEQTEGEPLPTIDVPVLTGDEGAALYGRMEAVALEDNLIVERDERRLPRPETMGLYSPTERLIVVRDAAPRQMTKTLAHELAHHFGGAIVPSAEEETIAESVAYVVCARFGLDTGERSFPYVATWSKDTPVFKRALGRIADLSGQFVDRLERQDQAPSTP